MNYFELVKSILTMAGRHKLVNEVFYGDVYEFHNSGDKKYCTFVLTNTNATENGDTTTYTFNAFVTDRLTDDKSNKLEVQSLSKTILEQILAECFDSLDSTTYTFWTEKFNDLCAGCYVTFTVSLPKELICADDELFDRIVKEINANGTYIVDGYDEVKVSVLPTTEELELDITSNGTYEVTPKDADSISKVTANVDINYEQAFIDAGGKFAYSTMSKLSHSVKLPADSSNLFRNSKIEEVDNGDFSAVTNASCLFYYDYYLEKFNGDLSNGKNFDSVFCGCIALKEVGDIMGSSQNCNSLFNYCNKLETIGVINMTNTTMIGSAFLCSSLKNIGGLLNLGKSYNVTLDLQKCPLTSQSVTNIADTVYDLTTISGRACTVKFKADVYSALTDEQKTKFANKGWTIASA